MTLLLGFGAVNTGNNLMYLQVSALLGFMAVSGLLGKANLARLELKALAAPELYAERQASLSWVLVNHRKKFPAFLIELTTGHEHTVVPLLAAGQRTRIRLPHTFTHRGEHQLPVITLRSHFPINFFVRQLRLPPLGKVLVFPTPLESREPVADSPISGQPRQRLDLPGPEGDLRAIVDYSGTEPMRSVHWKLSARHNQLKIKQSDSLGGNPIIIDVDRLLGHREEQLGQACWLIDKLARQQRPVGLKLGNRILPAGNGLSHRLRLLGELARDDSA